MFSSKYSHTLLSWYDKDNGQTHCWHLRKTKQASETFSFVELRLYNMENENYIFIIQLHFRKIYAKRSYFPDWKKKHATQPWPQKCPNPNNKRYFMTIRVTHRTVKELTFRFENLLMVNPTIEIYTYFGIDMFSVQVWRPSLRALQNFFIH